MPRATFFTLLALAAAFDSRDVAPAEWVCGGGALTATFPGGAVADCVSEVLRPAALTMPTIVFAAAAAPTTYTLLVVDRDAPNASVPIRGPLRHAAFARVSARLLREGLDWRALNSGNNDSAIALFNYSGPGPGPGSGCHRYYIMLYEEPAGLPPPFIYDPSRYAFDFPTFAANFSLMKVPSATTFFRTQNFEARTGPCDAAPAAAAAGSSLALGLGLGLGLGVPAAALLARALLQRARNKPGVIGDAYASM